MQPFRWFGHGLVVALVVPVAVLLATACLGPVRELYPSRSDEAFVTVHVVGHGWHTGIVIRRDDIPTEAWPEAGRFPAASFLEVGWGDRAFYESPDAGVRLALKAAVASAASVLHVAGFDRPASESFPSAEIIAIELSPRGMESLSRFVSQAYARDAAGRPIELGPGLYRGSRFYAATGRYSLVNTCNTWIAEACERGLSDHARLGGHGGQPAVPGRAVRAGHAALMPASARATAASSPRPAAWRPRPRRGSVRSRRTTRGDPGRWGSTA